MIILFLGKMLWSAINKYKPDSYAVPWGCISNVCYIKYSIVWEGKREKKFLKVSIITPHKK